MSDAVAVALITLCSMALGGLIQGWFNRRKTNGDAYGALMDALSKGGEAIGKGNQTIEDLLGMLVELPQLRSQLRTAQDRISVLERQSSFWISFARTYYDGSRKLHAQVLRLAVEQPEFEPGKFPTGPLSTGSVAQ